MNVARGSCHEPCSFYQVRNRHLQLDEFLCAESDGLSGSDKTYITLYDTADAAQGASAAISGKSMMY